MTSTSVKVGCIVICHKKNEKEKIYRPQSVYIYAVKYICSITSEI